MPDAPLPLSGRLALVTGASRGLGRAVALALARAGADVMLACRERRSLAEEAAQTIRGLGRRAATCAADLAEPKAASRVVAEAARALGGLDLVVACAGVMLNRLLVQTAEEDWDRVLAVNLTANVRICRATAPLAEARGGGAIVLVSSYAGVTGREGQAAYAASKAGLIGLAKTLAREWASKNLRVNVILPGYMPTEMGLAAGPEVMEKARSDNVLGRLSDPEEAAAFVADLCAFRQISGQVFNLDSRLGMRNL